MFLTFRSPDHKAPRNGLLERPPSVATVQTLSLMAIYEGICSGENSIETTWALMGLACKLSQSVRIKKFFACMCQILTRCCFRLAYVRKILDASFIVKYQCDSHSDRDCARWKLTPAEVQKRRALFWELFITDCWQVGLLLSFSLNVIERISRASQLVDSQPFHCLSSTANCPPILTIPSQKMVLSSLAVSICAPARCS
jgi:hypothetical protein